MKNSPSLPLGHKGTCLSRLILGFFMIFIYEESREASALSDPQREKRVEESEGGAMPPALSSFIK